VNPFDPVATPAAAPSSRPPLEEIERELESHASRTWLSLEVETIKKWIAYTRELERAEQVRHERATRASVDAEPVPGLPWGAIQ
jgi:hypothetical protein